MKKITINLAYASKEFSLVMSDRRLSYGLTGEYGYIDSTPKLVNIKNLGWSTGAGLYNFIIPFNKVLSKANIVTTDDIIDLYNRIIKRTYDQYPEYRDKLKETSVTFSFAARQPNSYKYKLAIGVLQSKKFEVENIQLCPENVIRIIEPSDYKGNIKSFNKTSENYKPGSLEDIVETFLLLFEEMSRESSTTSRECDIGIYKLKGTLTSKYKISGHIDDLLEKSSKGQIKDLMSPVKDFFFRWF